MGSPTKSYPFWINPIWLDSSVREILSFKINWCGHHTTFTLVFSLFEIIIPISSFKLLYFGFLPIHFEKTGKSQKKLRLNRHSRFYNFNPKHWVLSLAIDILSFKGSKLKDVRLTLSEI